jgi:hypothetical protein
MWKTGRQNSDRCRQVVVSSGLTVLAFLLCMQAFLYARDLDQKIRLAYMMTLIKVIVIRYWSLIKNERKAKPHLIGSFLFVLRNVARKIKIVHWYETIWAIWKSSPVFNFYALKIENNYCKNLDVSYAIYRHIWTM